MSGASRHLQAGPARRRGTPLKPADVGRLGEELACGLLKKHGYRVIERNVRGRYGEIDIVARKKDCTAFVEVRTRTGAGFGTPEESITRHKRDKMVTCALDYVAHHDELRDAAWRIDVVAIELDEEGRQTRAEIIESAVPLD
ncbi:MAG: YraN family protein [Dehalococcoidia bacterium]|nr:YraN family protein [Dehalococcoidia bacterium]